MAPAALRGGLLIEHLECVAQQHRDDLQLVVPGICVENVERVGDQLAGGSGGSHGDVCSSREGGGPPGTAPSSPLRASPGSIRRASGGGKTARCGEAQAG